jgi:nucleoside-diphosphate-sugar epimerase
MGVRAEVFWLSKELRMLVSVVGATGVLGRALVPLLAAHGHKVRAFAPSRLRATPEVLGNSEFIECDLLSPEQASRLPYWMEGCGATIHIATAVPRDPSAPRAWETNARLRREGTRKLLTNSIAVGVEKYIQQSVVMAYADGGDNWLDESAPLDRSPERAAIAAPVIAMEDMVRGTPVTRLKWTILRAGLFVGSGTGQEQTLARLRAGTYVVAGDGSNFISPVHVADMAAAVLAALEKAPPASTFNIVDEPLRKGEYVDRLAAMLHVPPPRRDPSQPRPPSFRCTNRAARETLGWKPERGIWPKL